MSSVSASDYQLQFQMVEYVAAEERQKGAKEQQDQIHNELSKFTEDTIDRRGWVKLHEYATNQLAEKILLQQQLKEIFEKKYPTVDINSRMAVIKRNADKFAELR